MYVVFLTFNKQIQPSRLLQLKSAQLNKSNHHLGHFFWGQKMNRQKNTKLLQSTFQVDPPKQMYPYISVGLSERAGGLGPSSRKYHTMLKQYIVEKKEKVSLLCAFWTIWREKNRRNFKNCENQDQTIKSSFLNLFWEWVRLFIGNNSL